MNSLDESIIDAGQIIAQIVGESRRQRDVGGLYATVSTAQIASLKSLRQKAWVNAHWPIAWPVWPPGIKAKFIALTQKIIRHFLSWYINPIVHQQNEFNQVVLEAINIMTREVLELRTLYIRERGAQQTRIDSVIERLDTWQQILEKMTLP